MYTKYPRTFHLPWSKGTTDDDKLMSSTSQFRNKDVIVTEKMDGENTTLYRDHMHARSIDSRYHPSRNWVKGFQAQIGWQLPEGWRVCGENVYAKHSISYEDLASYFFGFSIWNQDNLCLSWPKTETWFEHLGIIPVPVVYDGTYDEDKIQEIGAALLERPDCEGYVIRNKDCFQYDDFSSMVGKCVRENHVQTDTHWMHQEVTPNKLKK